MKSMWMENKWETTKEIVANHLGLILSVVIVAMMIIGCGSTAIRV